jgi:hypothetical protein
MPRTLAVTLLLVLLTTTSGAAQNPLVAGDRVRFRTEPKGDWRRGTFVMLREGHLVLTADTAHVEVPVASLARLEVRRPHRFDGRAALAHGGLGFGLGGAAMGVLALTDDESEVPVWRIAASGALVGAGAAALGGGGTPALVAARVGVMLGAAGGALIGLTSAEECEPNSLVCFGPGLYAFLGAGAGGIAGGLVAAWVGAFVGEEWEWVAPFRLTAAPRPHGSFAIAVSLPR